MDEQLDIIGRFRNASDWFGAAFRGFESCSQAEAEQSLGITFPAAYVNLIAELRREGVPLKDILHACPSSCVQSWPEHLVPFFEDGLGNLYCFDTRAAGAGEYPVAFWDHELGRDENLARAVKTDTSFSAWLTRYAQDEIPAGRPKELAKGYGTGCLIALAIIVFLAAVGFATAIRWLMQP